MSRPDQSDRMTRVVTNALVGLVGLGLFATVALAVVWWVSTLAELVGLVD